MLESFLFFFHYALLLIFGLLLSFCLVGLRHANRKNIAVITITFILCGLLQIFTFSVFDELTVWKIYPLITHLPLVLLLKFYFHKNIVTVLTAVSTSYLCCQPSKWFGILCEALSGHYVLEQCIRIAVLLVVGIFVIVFLAPYLSQLFNKEPRTILIFGSIPMIYYIFDYLTGIYTNLGTKHYRLITEFTPSFLCFIFILFCFIYYKEYEQKNDAEYREKLFQIFLEQQEKEMEIVRSKEHEVRLLRHDMRLLLNNIALCIEQLDFENAQKMITSYTSHIESTSLVRFCIDDTVNYILSDFAAKCNARHISFTHTIEIEEIHFDKVIFSSILSNILDNALNAQLNLPTNNRTIKLMMKDSDGKLLLSVKNTVDKAPVFVDGLPVTSQKGHGLGVQSISYMTKRLGGNCQFTVQNNVFITRIVL